MNAHAKEHLGNPVDTRALRDVLGQYATGVAVITTLGDKGAPVGVAANSFASVSLDPPLVVWSLALSAPSLSAFRTHSSFVVNVMCEESRDLVMKFGRPSDNKFENVKWRAGLAGAPILEGAAAVIQCRTHTRVPGGDHEMYLGQVYDFTSTEKKPLLFHKGKFATLGDMI